MKKVQKATTCSFSSLFYKMYSNFQNILSEYFFLMRSLFYEQKILVPQTKDDNFKMISQGFTQQEHLIYINYYFIFFLRNFFIRYYVNICDQLFLKYEHVFFNQRNQRKK